METSGVHSRPAMSILGSVAGMGYIEHAAVIVTVSDYANDDRDLAPGPKVEAFRESLPEEWRALVIGPVRAVVNGYGTYAFLADGSSPFDAVEVRYGGDFQMEFDGPRAADPRERP